MKKIVCCLISMQFIGLLAQLPERTALKRNAVRTAIKHQNRFSCSSDDAVSEILACTVPCV